MSAPYNFSLTATQIKKFQEWKTQFAHLDEGAIAGTFSFKFTPTSILTIVQVSMEHGFGADATVSVLDLTDYDDI